VVPFTSESKEAVASYPEIMKESSWHYKIGAEAGDLHTKGFGEADAEKKARTLEQYIPHIGIAYRKSWASRQAEGKDLRDF